MFYCYGYGFDYAVIIACNNYLLPCYFKVKVYCQSNLVLSTRNSCLSFGVVPVISLSFLDVT